MEPKTLIPILQGILNVPDLILLAIILVSAILGASRGLVRTVCNALGRLVAFAGATAAAKMLAPVLARFLVTPIVGQVFEVRAADLLSRIPESVTDNLQMQATEMAAEMAESLAFFLLFFIFMIAMNILVHMVSTALRLVTRIGPIGFLDGLAGMALGAVFGAVLCFLGLWALTVFAPSTFGELGALAPDVVEGTTLTAFVLGLIPSL